MPGQENLVEEQTESTRDAAKPSAEEQPKTRSSPILVDESQAVAAYANFCRVTGTPEELIVDFGLNPQPMGVPSAPIAISQRIVLSFYTAKRLAGALQVALQRHEKAFGNLETDVQKRAVSQKRRPALPAR